MDFLLVQPDLSWYIMQNAEVYCDWASKAEYINWGLYQLLISSLEIAFQDSSIKYKEVETRYDTGHFQEEGPNCYCGDIDEKALSGRVEDCGLDVEISRTTGILVLGMLQMFVWLVPNIVQFSIFDYLPGK